MEDGGGGQRSETNGACAGHNYRAEHTHTHIPGGRTATGSADGQVCVWCFLPSSRDTQGDIMGLKQEVINEQTMCVSRVFIFHSSYVPFLLLRFAKGTLTERTLHFPLVVNTS